MKYIAAILACLILCGCDKQSDDSARMLDLKLSSIIETQKKQTEKLENLPDVRQEIQNALTPVLEEIQQSKRKPDTAVKTTGWTGALVHIGSNCGPCEKLKSDLKKLSECTDWTVGISADCHWRLVFHGDDGFEIPLIEYIKNGTIVHRIKGYGESRERADYAGEIDTIIERHPNGDPNWKRKAKQSDMGTERLGGSVNGYRSSGTYSNGRRARVTGYDAYGRPLVQADDNATVREMHEAIAQDNYEVQMFKYRQQQVMQQQYQSYQYPVYGSTYYGGSVGYRGRVCINGICY